MPKHEPVNIVLQIVLMFIPFVWIFAFWRIEKLVIGIVLLICTAILSVVVQMILPYPFGLYLSYPISFLVPIYFIWKWSNEWNDTIQKKPKPKCAYCGYLALDDRELHNHQITCEKKKLS